MQGVHMSGSWQANQVIWMICDLYQGIRTKSGYKALDQDISGYFAFCLCLYQDDVSIFYKSQLTISLLCFILSTMKTFNFLAISSLKFEGLNSKKQLSPTSKCVSILQMMYVSSKEYASCKENVSNKEKLEEWSILIGLRDQKIFNGTTSYFCNWLYGPKLLWV